MSAFFFKTFLHVSPQDARLLIHTLRYIRPREASDQGKRHCVWRGELAHAVLLMQPDHQRDLRFITAVSQEADSMSTLTTRRHLGIDGAEQQLSILRCVGALPAAPAPQVLAARA